MKRQDHDRSFETMSKRRSGFQLRDPRQGGERIVHGDKQLIEKLGRNDPPALRLGTPVSRPVASPRTGFVERDYYER